MNFTGRIVHHDCELKCLLIVSTLAVGSFPYLDVLYFRQNPIIRQQQLRLEDTLHGLTTIIGVPHAHVHLGRV